MTSWNKEHIMIKRHFSLLAAILFLFLISFGRADAQVMTDYCQVPPYVIQNVPPNVMVVVDNSGSMYNFAYSDGFSTTNPADDNSCANSSSPCTGFTTPGAYPTSAPTATYDWTANPNHYYKYYGYFDPDYWYTYTTNRFVPSAPKTGSGLAGSRAKATAEWDGNFLNWLSMRRIDVLRKVLSGGKDTSGEGSGFDRLIGERADDPIRGLYKSVPDASGYVDNAYSGARCFIFDSSNAAGTSSFTVKDSGTCGSGGSSSSAFNVAVRVPSPVEGVVQDVSTKVRLGLAFYHTNTSSSTEGGFIQVAVTGTSLSSVINQINGHSPDSNTPLAETLWTVTGYFEQLAEDPNFVGGPGPRYNNGDYQINNNNDPFNYGTGGATRFPKCANSFVLFITDGEPCADGNLPTALKDYASGRSIFDCDGGICPAVSAVASGETYSFPETTFPSCGAGNFVAGMEDVALYMHTTDLRSNIPGNQTLTLYPVFAFGKGSTLLKFAAINGAFTDLNGNGIPDLQSEWDKNGDGQPDTYFEATDGSELEKAIKDAFSNMIARVASGTAASVLASGEGRGSNLIQASFYPRRRFGNDVIEWIGGIQNLWYYLDPQFAQTNLREDTVQDSMLQVKQDYIMKFFFDTVDQSTKAAFWRDDNGDGSLLSRPTPSVKLFEDVKNIWDAGKTLWNRDISANPRTIYTSVSGTTLLPFTTANAGTLASYMSTTDAANVITYLNGTDIILDLNNDNINDYRSRTVMSGNTTKVWKLGDILNSTPKIASSIPLNPYWAFVDPSNPTNRIYNDTTYDNDTGTPAYVKTNTYRNRGVVFVGANDGMLHAFNFGKLEVKWTGQGQFEKARLINPDTGAICSPTDTNPCGAELWAFIPRNVLPYLKYIPDPDYCHIYSVDLAPVVFDASIGTTGCTEANYWNCDKVGSEASWRTVIIGGMRLGGGCRNIGTSCNNDGIGTADCVKTPANGLGYSSYFALDVTDQNNPQLLWEFSSPDLGFATSGPAIVRISAKDGTGAPVHTKNGRWFVVFGSGPTGPIDSSFNQFLGRSDQNLKLFILDLKTGSPVRTIDTGIPFAFAGSMYHSVHDMDWPNHRHRYQDDAIYIPYTMRTSSSPYTWTNGGILNLLTTNPLTANKDEDLNPDNWVWRKVVEGSGLSNIGPVTASVQNLDDVLAQKSWIYFGTGRYYFAQGTTLDDADSQRRLYGLVHPCAIFTAGGAGESDYMHINPTCTDMINLPDAQVINVTNIGNVPTSSTAISAMKGWYVDLDSAGTYTYSPDPGRTFGAERLITDPFADPASEAVFFTTYKPYTEECSLGGKSFIWALKYNTGGVPENLRGNVMVQLSTGSIEQVNLQSALTGAGGRKSAAMEGEPPRGEGMAIIGSPPGASRVLQIKER
jgi:type IV pilus assembly protein PilY1